MLILKKYRFGAVEIRCSSTWEKKAPLCGRPRTHEDFTYPLAKCDNAGNSNQACNSCKGPGIVC